MGARRAVEGVGELFGYFQHRETADSDHRDLMYVGAPADEFVDRARAVLHGLLSPRPSSPIATNRLHPIDLSKVGGLRGVGTQYTATLANQVDNGRFRNVFRPCCRLEVSGDITDISGSKPSAPTNTGDAYPKGWKDALWADEKQMFDAIADGLDSNGSAETVTHHIDRMCRQLRAKAHRARVRKDRCLLLLAGRAS